MGQVVTTKCRKCGWIYKFEQYYNDSTHSVGDEWNVHEVDDGVMEVVGVRIIS